MHKPSVNDYFTPESIYGSDVIRMLEFVSKNSKSIYVLNRHGDKLLKLAIKNEKLANSAQKCAQVKIILYGIKRAYVWNDLPSDPDVVALKDNIEITYHGSRYNNRSAKVHLKSMSGYKTILDDSLELQSDWHHPVPLFALETGYANDSKRNNPVTKSGHKVSSEYRGGIRFDFYLAGKNMDQKRFLDSIYFFMLFFTQDYLASSTRNELTGGKIIAPIKSFLMGEYQVIVRRSVSKYVGRPKLIFYKNRNYFSKFMDRSLARRNADGSMSWSTMRAEEERLSQYYEREKET